MNIVLLADSYVGLEITKYLLKNYKEDVLSLICIEKNDIINLVSSENITYVICSNKEDLDEYLSNLEFDLGILAWWPRSISSKIISQPKYDFVNTHNSFLPNNRGKHPYFWAMVEERDYDVTLHWVDEGYRYRLYHSTKAD